MKDDTANEKIETIVSSISSEIKRRSLYFGSLLGAGSVVILMIFGSYAPIAIVERYGLWAFVSLFLLVALGLKPYKRLLKLELNPHQLHCDGKICSFYAKKKLVFSLQTENILSVRFIQKSYIYGVGVDLAKSIEAPASLKRFDCDLFFPFFSKRSFDKFHLMMHGGAQSKKVDEQGKSKED